MTQLDEIGKTRVFHAGRGKTLATAADANDLIGEAISGEADLVTIPVERLGPEFLTLGTGVAGDFLQKFVNLGLGCAIVGDISDALNRSKALRDFVRETNKGNSVWFLQSFEQLRDRLEGSRTAS